MSGVESSAGARSPLAVAIDGCDIVVLGCTAALWFVIRGLAARSAATWVVVTQPDRLSSGEWGAPIVRFFHWMIPLALGRDLSLHCAESLLLPMVILLVRLQPTVVAVFAVACVSIAYRMAQLFFDAMLI